MEEQWCEAKGKEVEVADLKKSGLKLNAFVMFIHEGMQSVTFSIRSLS